MRQRIANTQPVTTWEEFGTNKYYYETNNKFIKWLLSKLIKHKLIQKKEYINRKEKFTYKEFSIDSNDIERFIMEQMDNNYHLNRIEMEKILIGSRYLNELGIQISKNILLPYMPMGRLEKIAGVPLVLCPYIDGIVFVPKDDR